MTLEEKIKSEIKENGHVSVDRFMEIALFDKDKGYYIKKNPIGVESDFITSPEISVLFGEILGLFVVNQIREKLQRFDKINLIELGAGKGTLLNDILNLLYKFPDIYQKINAYILDINEVLVEIQKQTLINHKDRIKWIGNLDEISSPSPHIYICNEFFDALPIKQFIKSDGEIKERVIKLDNEQNFILDEISTSAPDIILNDAEDYNENQVIEYSHDSIKFMEQISNNLLKNKGFSVLIDYGHIDFVSGDTLQSIQSHKYNNIFKNIGDADLTAHVNFRMLYNTALRLGLKDLFVTSQAEFLKSMGIIQRAEVLAEKMSDKQKIDLFIRLNRIIDNTQMGDLFKVFVAENF